MLSGTRLYQEPWLIFSWHGSSPSSWSKMELEIIKTSFCPVTNWSCSLGNIQALSWIFFYLTRVSFIKLQLFSTRWVFGVVRVLKSSSFSYLQSCRVCVCVCARWFLLAHTCVTHSPCHLAVPQYSLCALQNATFCIEIENKMLTDFKKPQNTTRHRSQVAKHTTGAFILSLILIIKFT